MTSETARTSPDLDADSVSELLVVTGMSGAGRSTVANALEDLGWFVVDNLPPRMVAPLVSLAVEHASKRVAVVVDVRGGRMFADLFAAVEALRGGETRVSLLFLTASDAALVRRYEQVRRPHPLQGSGTLLSGISAERERMTELLEAADLVIDTSDLNVHQLTSAIVQQFAADDAAQIQVTLLSFGFKYGLPSDVDMVADMRFLPNPHWIPELRPLTGTDAPVREAVLTAPGAGEFLDTYRDLLSIVFAGYATENKRYATVAVGCTGGKHRSVAMAIELADRLAHLPGVSVTVAHRDLGRE